jgi:hypothetical protein
MSCTWPVTGGGACGGSAAGRTLSLPGGTGLHDGVCMSGETCAETGDAAGGLERGTVGWSANCVAAVEGPAVTPPPPFSGLVPVSWLRVVTDCFATAPARATAGWVNSVPILWRPRLSGVAGRVTATFAAGIFVESQSPRNTFRVLYSGTATVQSRLLASLIDVARPIEPSLEHFRFKESTLCR